MTRSACEGRTHVAGGLAFWPYAAVGVVFLVSSLIYRQVFGVRFDASPIDWFVQYIDPWFVEHDFLRSLLHLNHQAPFQNLLVGSAIRALGRADGLLALELLYLALGLATALATLHVMLRLGASRALSVIAVSLYVAAPGTVLYEHWLFYETPVACLLVTSIALLIHYYRRGTFGAGLAYFSSLAAVALFRSTFGLVFMAAAIAVVTVSPPRAAPTGLARRWAVMKAAMGPVLVLGLNALRIAVLVGPGADAVLFWGDIAEKISLEMPGPARQRARAAGKVSDAADHFSLSDLRELGAFRTPVAPTGVPILDWSLTPDGDKNTHALEYVAIMRRFYRPDALYLISNYPQFYVRAVVKALTVGLVSSKLDADILSASRNRARVRSLDLVAQRLLGKDGTGRLEAVALGLASAVAYAFFRVVHPARRRESQRCAVAAMATMLLMVVYVTLVSVLISFGDFSRYRSQVDPIILVLVTLLVSDVVRSSAVRVRDVRRSLAAARTRRERARRLVVAPFIRSERGPSRPGR